MTLEASFETLCLRLQRLQDVVTPLHVTVIEDRPLEGAVALVDEFSNAAEDLLGTLSAAFEAAKEARQAVKYPPDAQGARRSLVICQEQFNDCFYRLFSNPISYERLAELTSFGSKRGGEWGAWTDIVKDAIDRCRQPAFDVNQALSLCWQEIADRLGMNSVSVQATNIGQKIEIPEGKEMVAKGVP